MYKSRLQELCQQRRLPMPKYDTEKMGLDHSPRFRVTVSVNGLSFTGPRECGSAKEAQNEAAKVAVLHFTTPTSTAPVVASSAVQSPSSSSAAAAGSSSPPPVPGHGSLHASQYKAKVTVDDWTFESPQSFNLLKEAENAVARVASMTLSRDEDEDTISMYKNLLLELAQKEGLSAPAYETSVDGPPHIPVFSSTVLIEGEKFNGTAAKSKKQAEQNAAKVAWCALKEHYRDGTSEDCTGLETNSNVCSVVSHYGQHEAATSSVDDSNSQSKYVDADMKESLEDGLPLASVELKSYANVNVTGLTGVGPSSKTQLQIYAQKRNLNLPSYECVREGSLHCLRYKAKVTVDGQTFESPKSFNLLKEAENAAARVALMSLSVNENHEDSIPLYKNLLLEFAQKEGLTAPVYETSMGGPSHIPLFTSTVQIVGEKFNGTAARTKKQAEQNAAKVALSLLEERKSSRRANQPPNFDVCQDIKIASSDIRSAITDASLLPEWSPPEASSGSTSCIQPAGEPDYRDGSSEESTRMETSSCVRAMVSHYPQQETAKSSVIDSGSQADNALVGFSAEMKESHGDGSPLSPVKLESHANTNAEGKIPSVQPHCRVQVYPWTPNFVLPEGGSVLPFSDDKWVAVSFDSAKK